MALCFDSVTQGGGLTTMPPLWYTTPILNTVNLFNLERLLTEVQDYEQICVNDERGRGADIFKKTVYFKFLFK